MEVARIDAYMARWSNDAEIAVASESAGLQFLSPDAVVMNSEEILKLNRNKTPIEFPKGRIIDMQWGPTFTGPKGGCVLAVVLDTGVLVLLENSHPSEAQIVEIIQGLNFSAVTWLGRQLIAGDTAGNIHIINEKGEVQKTTPIDSSLKLPVLYLVSSNIVPEVPEIGAVLADNSGWMLRGPDNWEQVTPSSRFSVVSACLCDHKLVTLRCGQFYVDNKVSTTNSLLPGFLLTSSVSKECLAIHSNGTRTEITANSGSITLPQIQGDVIHAEIHPYLPMCIVILNKGSAAKLDETANQWKFPILSSQDIAVYMCPIPGVVTSPQRSQYDFTAYWLSCLVNPSQYTNIMALNQPITEIAPDLSQIRDDKPLADQLNELFMGSFGDLIRLKFYLARSPPEQEEVLKTMRSAITCLLDRATAESPIDKLVLSLYKAITGTDESSEFTLTGDGISDTFKISESNASQKTIKSIHGRVWKRCALTLLPILVMSSRESADRNFTVYQYVPKSLSGTPSEDNPLTEALLNAGHFCVYNGTQWLY